MFLLVVSMILKLVKHFIALFDSNGYVLVLYYHTQHNCMATADSAVILLELDVQWDFAQAH